MYMHPSTHARPTDSHAELDLYTALSRVNQDWYVFHSLKLRTKDGFEGEGDFVIVDPRVGLLVLEVKGGRLEVRDGHWLQNGEPMKKAPRDQAQSFVRNLVAELGENVPWGIACAFPDCEFSEPPSHADLRGLVIGKRELRFLDEALPAVFQRAVRAGRVPQNRKWVERLKSMWGKTWVPAVSLADRVADEAEARKAISLDAKQYELLEYAEGTQRALVEGGAGTGKTLVATELCRRRAAGGVKTQYLCFTDALAKAVQRDFAGVPNVQATSVRQLAVDLLRSSGAVIPPPDKAFWDSVSLQAACDALPAVDERPAMLVVDEGQDFEASDWTLVEELAGPRGLWVFRDERQAFWTDRPLPEGLSATLGAKLTLKKAYRCPGGLAAWAETFVGGPPAPRPDESVLREVPCRDDEVTARTRHELETLLKNGAKPSDICVVSLSGQTRSALFNAKEIGTVPVVRADAANASEHVVMETFLRFKGLERPFIIVTELGGTHVTHFGTRMHIALTRATVQAIVITSPPLPAKRGAGRGEGPS